MDRKKSGFTLAELLIVVAIIAVLVAISIPVFSSQLEKARRAVDVENARNIRSVLANAINDESFVFNNKDAMLEVVVSRNEKNGGFSGNNGQVKNDLIINGVQYHNASDGNLHGYKLVWDFLEKNGIQKNLTMKQKSSGVTWYGVQINGNGERYYLEGTGDIGKNAKKYAWSDLNTPIK